MKNSVITLSPITDGFIVLTKVTTTDGETWVAPEECGYSFHLMEHDDGSASIYRVYPDGSIDIDRESILMQVLYCMHCGERLKPDLNSETGHPDSYNYHCVACGHLYEIGREDVCL